MTGKEGGLRLWGDLQHLVPQLLRLLSKRPYGLRARAARSRVRPAFTTVVGDCFRFCVK